MRSAIPHPEDLPFLRSSIHCFWLCLVAGPRVLPGGRTVGRASERRAHVGQSERLLAARLRCSDQPVLGLGHTRLRPPSTAESLNTILYFMSVTNRIKPVWIRSLATSSVRDGYTVSCRRLFRPYRLWIPRGFIRQAIAVGRSVGQTASQTDLWAGSWGRRERTLSLFKYCCFLFIGWRKSALACQKTLDRRNVKTRTYYIWYFKKPPRKSSYKIDCDRFRTVAGSTHHHQHHSNRTSVKQHKPPAIFTFLPYLSKNSKTLTD